MLSLILVWKPCVETYQIPRSVPPPPEKLELGGGGIGTCSDELEGLCFAVRVFGHRYLSGDFFF